MNFKIKKFVVAGGALGLGLWGLANSLFLVESGHHAVIFNKILGIRDKVHVEGKHYRIPWLETPVFYDIRAHPFKGETSFACFDHRMARVGILVLAHPDPEQLITSCREHGPDHIGSIMPSISEHSIEFAGSQFKSSEVIHKNEDFVRAIKERLTKRASRYYIGIDDVSVTNVTFEMESGGS